eukprot:CAMPEP_0184644246 /NCGR_PEP_ID=MMETSP0308-20130426/1006_1 /TAXON_ID=38269 /ORGANISM="Gloeochaete witrockiana, Strain SAG 46.84" /LENGTH=106 /DNA_ID=CAMNT_0027072677 /DNA_START=32 /DNA_END=349 /DNA_ORIENTATION=+
MIEMSNLLRHSTVNYYAILLATVIDYTASAAYFAIFSKTWKTGLGKGLNTKKSMLHAYIASFIGSFMVQYGIARVALHFPGISPIMAALFVWVCFISSTLATDQAW